MTEEIHHIPPLIAQLIRKDLGKYGGHSGTNKLFHLMSATDNAIPNIGWIKVAEEVTKEIDEMKKYEVRTGNHVLSRDLKNWNHIYKKLQELRPILGHIQFEYDKILKKKMDDKSEASKVLNYKILNKKALLYQPEIYYIFQKVMALSNLQMSVIPNEFFRTPESQQYVKGISVKKTPQTTSQTVMSDST